MPVLAIHVRQRMLTALEGVPAVLARLLQPLAPEAPAWDLRPDPERFTLREIAAHLADWELVWRERLDRTLAAASEIPVLPYHDPDQRAAQFGYAASQPRQSLAVLHERRRDLVEWLRSLEEAEWDRSGRHERHGVMTVEMQAVQIMTHDGSHLQQVASWLAVADQLPQ
jgi:hypothetical protein